MFIATGLYTHRVAHARCAYTFRALPAPLPFFMLPSMSSDVRRDPYTAAVGRRLAEARKDAIPKLSQAKAAEAASALLETEITPQALGNYEQGTRLPSPVVVDALCRVYRTRPASYVLGLTEAPQTQHEAQVLERYRVSDAPARYAVDHVLGIKPSPE